MITRCFVLCLCLIAFTGCKSEDPPADKEKDDPLASAKVEEAQLDLLKLHQAIQIYYITYGGPPTALEQLVDTPDGYKLLEELPKDPWGNDYRLEAGEDGMVPYSAGPDGAPFTDDDVKDAAKVEGAATAAPQ